MDNLRTFPPLCLLALLCVAGIFAWFTRRVIFAQIWYDLRLCFREGGWDGVREFLQTGMIPWPNGAQTWKKNTKKIIRGE